MPDATRFAAAVLGCQVVLAVAGLADIATTWPEGELVSDEQLGELADHWADSNPWS